MNLAATELVELEEDELETDWALADASIDDALSLEDSENADDDPDALDTEQEPDEVLDDGGIDVVVQYFQESARHQLLSVAQERALIQTVARGVALQRNWRTPGQS